MFNKKSALVALLSLFSSTAFAGDTPVSEMWGWEYDARIGPFMDSKMELPEGTDLTTLAELRGEDQIIVLDCGSSVTRVKNTTADWASNFAQDGFAIRRCEAATEALVALDVPADHVFYRTTTLAYPANDIYIDAYVVGEEEAEVVEPGLVLTPYPDRDGDGYPDPFDECPDEPGSIILNGCPLDGGLVRMRIGARPGVTKGQTTVLAVLEAAIGISEKDAIVISVAGGLDLQENDFVPAIEDPHAIDLRAGIEHEMGDEALLGVDTIGGGIGATYSTDIVRGYSDQRYHYGYVEACWELGAKSNTSLCPYGTVGNSSYPVVGGMGNEVSAGGGFTLKYEF